MYEVQKQQKAEGRKRRNALRLRVKTFRTEFRAQNHREPTAEEIAVYFQRSRTWVLSLEKTAAEDAEPAGKGAR